MSVIQVAAASDLVYALEELMERYESSHPNVDVRATFGSSGNFCTQLQSRAPFDMFLSADIDYPRRLIAEGLAVADTEFQYAVGRLALWVRNESPLDLATLEIQAVLDPSVRKIAIANPRHAPYGRAAAAALRHYQLDQQVADKMILGENVAQAAQFVETGGADLGIIALSLAASPTMQSRGRYWEIPLAAYPRLDQGGVVMNWAANRDATLEFREFICGDQGREVLERYGFRQAGD